MSWRVLELALLFCGVPAAMRWGPLPRNPLPLLLLGSLAAVGVLLADPGFDRALLWNEAGMLQRLGIMLLTTLATAPLLYGLARWLAPGESFALVRRQPRLWLLIMIAYPVVSVYPQEILYRAFFLHRYSALFATPAARIVASAVAFSWGHVFFRTPRVAMLLSLLGGALFAYEYQLTRSLLAASVEHAIFGDLIFTVGLGRYFYHAAEILERQPR